MKLMLTQGKYQPKRNISFALCFLAMSITPNIALAKKVQGSPTDFRALSFSLAEKGAPWSALDFIKEYLHKKTKTIDGEFDELLDKVVPIVGTTAFEHLPFEILQKSNASAIHFILAHKHFRKGKLAKSMEQLLKVEIGSAFYPESVLLKGSIYYLAKSPKRSIIALEECKKVAREYERKMDNELDRAYYQYLHDQCELDKARVYHKYGKYVAASNHYQKIPKTSAIWPYTLVEKAWGHFYQEDYNRVLGLLVTYKAPLLENYFMPEAEVLTALAYLRMCLWEDAMLVINHFYKIYSEKAQKLKSILVNNKYSDTYFYDLALGGNEEIEESQYIQNLVVQVKRSLFYRKSLKRLELINQEILRVQKDESVLQKEQALVSAQTHESALVREVNQYIKESMFRFINDMHKFSGEMFNIQLEVFSRKKDQIYQAEGEINERVRGDLSNVKRSKYQYFWDFTGEFWADDLGDYVFGLKSNCEIPSKAQE